MRSTLRSAGSGRITTDLYRKRPGGQAAQSRTQAGPGRFGSSRKKEAAPNLAGQLLIGYSIAIVIRHDAMLLQAEIATELLGTTLQLA
jgi:hypothetical protein